ncbi:NF038120 family PEP-CTERM protein [Duganella sp. PWIR1]
MKRALPAMMLGLSMLAAGPAARASSWVDVNLDFDNLAPGIVLHTDSFDLGNGFYMGAYSNVVGASGADLVGMVVDGTYASEQCGPLQCPAAASNYMAGLNDAYLYITSDPSVHNTFKLKSLDASFLGPVADNYPDTVGLLQIQAITLGGSLITANIPLPKPGLDGYEFNHFFTTGTFATTEFAEMYLFALACNDAGDCHAFDSNQGQFALDNLIVSVSAVPEPRTWLLMGAGLMLMGHAARRRNRA